MKLTVNEKYELDNKGVKDIKLAPSIFKPNCGEYCWYKDKVWKIFSTSTSSAANNISIGLVRYKNGECIYVKGGEIKKILLIMRPTGYLPI